MTHAPRSRRWAAFGAALVAMSVALISVPSVSNAASGNPKPKPGAAYTVAVSSPDTPTQPVAAPSGTPITLNVRVTNTTTSFNSGFVIVELTAPAGFSVSAPTVDLAGWTATINEQTVRAVAPQQSTGIKPGESVVLSLVALNSTAGTEVVPTTWRTAVSGPFGNPIAFALTGTPVTVVALARGFVAFASKPGSPLNGIQAPSAAGTLCVTSPANPVCSNASLTQGALSNVYFGQRPCPSTDTTCKTGTEVELAGDFGNLYSNDAPAKVVLICAGSKCPYPTTAPSGNYDANYLCTSSCAGNGGPFNKRVVNIDFAAYPAFVQLKGATSFGQAPRCVPVSDLTTTGRITSPTAKATGFCVDVNAITRTGNQFTGDLVRPILFVEDPRMR